MNDDLNERARQLVARYDADGLGGMTGADLRLLLSEKQLHLSGVSDLCRQGLDPQTNVPLKQTLEEEVGEIARYQEFKELLHDPEMDVHPDPQALFEEWREDYAAAKERDEGQKPSEYQELLDGASKSTSRDGRDEMER